MVVFCGKEHFYFMFSIFQKTKCYFLLCLQQQPIIAFIISFICQLREVMRKLISNRLKLYAREITAEELAGIGAGRSTSEQIFNLRILCEKCLQHQQICTMSLIFSRNCLKVFDRVAAWHAVLWSTMPRNNISANLVCTI